MKKLGILLILSVLCTLFLLGCSQAETEFATVTYPAWTHTSEPSPTPIPTSTYTPTPTLTTTSTPTSTITPTQTSSPSPTFTATPEPYNLSFEFDGGWAVNQDQAKSPYFYGEYSTKWSSHGKRSYVIHLVPPSEFQGSDKPKVLNPVELSQVVDLSGIKYIALDLKSIELPAWQRELIGRPSQSFLVFIDNEVVKEISFVPGELLNQYIPIKEFSGMHKIRFRCNVGFNYAEVGIYIDNIRLLSSLPPKENLGPVASDIPQKDILFSENFEDGEANKWETDYRWVGKNTWIVQKDAYGNRYWSGTGTRDYPQAWYSETNWTDYAFEVRFRNNSGEDNTGVFVCARASDEGNGFYTARLGTNGYEIAVYDGTTYRTLQKVDKKILKKHQWYLVRLEVQGNQIRLFVDNELLLSVIDNTLTKGSIGFYMGGGNWFEFDDLRVWSLPSEIITEIKWGFDSDGNLEGWKTKQQLTSLQTSRGYLITESTGNDPFMVSPPISADATFFTQIEIRMKVSAGNQGAIYFKTNTDSIFDESKVLRFSLICDGIFHSYMVDMTKATKWKDLITQIRFDPTTIKATIEIDYIRLIAPEN